jgi:hypothetical protein
MDFSLLVPLSGPLLISKFCQFLSFQINCEERTATSSIYTMNHQTTVLVANLTQASEGLLYRSESDYPYEVIHWEKAPLTEEFIRQKVTLNDTPIEILDFSDFYNSDEPEPDWYGEEEKAESAKFRHLMKLLADSLGHTQVFRLGKIEIDIYILGQTKSGEIVGLKTKAIET